jgi:hypothetical protein
MERDRFSPSMNLGEASIELLKGLFSGFWRGKKKKKMLFNYEVG